MLLWFLAIIPMIFILAGGGNNSSKSNGISIDRRVELMEWNTKRQNDN